MLPRAVQAGLSSQSAVVPPASAREGAEPVPPGMVGMWIFLVSESFAFGGLLVGYAVLRMGVRPGWPPQGAPSLPGWVGAAVAVCLVMAGVAVAFTEDALAHGILSRAWVAWGAAVLALLGALTLQLQGWVSLWPRLPLGPSTYAGSYYVLTGFHALHVLGGLAALVSVTPRSGVAAAPRTEVLGLYLHFLVLAQLLIVAAVCTVGA